MDATRAPGRPPSPARLEVRARLAAGERFRYGDYSDIAARHGVSRARVQELVGLEADRAGIDTPIIKGPASRLRREAMNRTRKRIEAVLSILHGHGTYHPAHVSMLAQYFELPLADVHAIAARLERRPASTVESGVFAPRRSAGQKIGPVAATYVSQASCPETCPFLGAGCYAENGFIGGFITKRLNRGSALTPLELARNEAAAIDRLPGTVDLRLHIVGDSTTVAGTRMIAAAAARYMERGGRRVWTYTHAWRMVPREAWGPVSVFASCESAADLAEARMRGYATALTVSQHPATKRYESGPFKILPCPEQTHPGVTCADCRLCTDDARMKAAGITISFEVHGSPPSRAKARRALTDARRERAKVG